MLTQPLVGGCSRTARDGRRHRRGRLAVAVQAAGTAVKLGLEQRPAQQAAGREDVTVQRQTAAFGGAPTAPAAPAAIAATAGTSGEMAAAKLPGWWGSSAGASAGRQAYGLAKLASQLAESRPAVWGIRAAFTPGGWPCLAWRLGWVAVCCGSLPTAAAGATGPRGCSRKLGVVGGLRARGRPNVCVYVLSRKQPW